MKPSLRGATRFAPAYPVARVITRLARMALVLALIFAATVPSSAGDPRTPRVIGQVFGWGSLIYDEPNVPAAVSGLGATVAIAGGDYHRLTLSPDGTVWSWGLNDSGQVGDGTIGTRYTPVQVLGPGGVGHLSGVVALAGGGNSSFALRGDGTVWAWGANASGQLGDGSTTPSPTPVQVIGVGGVGHLSGVVAIAAGSLHSLALLSDGTVLAWGRNNFGQLGSVAGGFSATPQIVSGVSAVKAIAGGVLHSVALRSDGTVWAWGYNQYGTLGDGSSVSYRSTPGPVSGLSEVAAIASSNSTHVLALKSDGTVWAWGSNQRGQLGDGSETDRLTPVQVSNTDGSDMLSNVSLIACGGNHSLALTTDGTLLAWGYGTQGQRGDGTNTLSGTRPVPVASSGLSDVVAIAGAGNASLAIRSQAIGAAWGDNTNGSLGNTGGTSSVPTAVDALTGLAAISAGGFHSVGLRADGTVWTWGNNAYGEMGIGEGQAGTSLPTQVMQSILVKAVATGEHHALALTSRGAVHAWGQNENGQTGVGTVLQSGFTDIPVSYLPHPVGHISASVVAVAAGAYHSLALGGGGTVWAWGANDWGQLGTPPDPYTSRSAPAQVPSGVGGGYLSGVVAIAAGGLHSLALKSDGTVWAWGRNADGELGNNQSAPSPLPDPAPVQVVDPSDPSGYLTGVVAIAAGSNFSLALKADGTVRAWGNNGIGQLGNGTTGASLVPAPVVVTDADHYLPGIVAIAAGYNHALAVKSNGLLLAWGWNSFGQLGNGATTVEANPTPVHVVGPQAPAAISAGYRHSLALALTYTPDPAIAGYITITADNKTVTYGGTVPTLTYSVTPSPDLDTPPTCTTTATSASTVGRYPITCSGAAKGGYIIDYLPGTLTVTAPVGTLNITPISQTMHYGGVPTFAYTVTGLPDGQSLDTGATCGVPGMAAPPVGTHVISCSGAAKDGYQIAYGSATLTVNPAPLTIIADNKSMGLGSTVPLLTASYFGLVNGDTPAIVGGSLGLTTADFGSPAGTYPITFTTVPTLTNYTVVTVPGTLTVNAGLLTFNNNYFVTGDFAVGSVPLVPPGEGSDGLATAEISIPNAGTPDPANTVPAGADIVAAYLYWQAVEWSGYVPQANGFFRDYAITGEQLGSDLPFSPVPAPELVSGGGSTVMRVYRANVLPYLPLDAEGRRLPAGPHTVRLPHGAASNSGASLVVIYRVLSKDVPLKAVVLYDGAWAAKGGLQLTIRGFYDASGQEAARRFNMASTASAFMPALAPLPPPEGSAGQYSEIFSATAGTAGGMLVFSIAVNDSDGDGLLDAWESAGGYNEVSDGSWVPLPGAVNGQKDMFAQLDYMCSAVKPDGTCDPENSRLPQPDPATGQDPLLMVQQAFDASGIKLHYLIGHAIQEETCQDDLTVDPPRLCQFPGEPGVVGWKTGLEVFKVWARDPAGCVAGNAESCRPRFERGQKDSYHYVLFGRSLAVAAWNTRARTLDSIVVSGGNATITTPARAPLNGSTCPTRVTISGALGAPELNGVYSVSGCQGNTGITIETPGVADWTYSKPFSPADEREPMLAVISGNVSSISGYSDLGGADSAVTLGKWAPNPNQPQNTKANVQAGTLMHELGHTIGLAHGGAYEDTAGSYALTYGGNCKPNYQSIMNYLFQIDLLPGNVLAFSRQALDTMDESAGSVTWTGNPTFPQTRWYVPWSSTVPGSPATRHCDGTPILDGATMVREDHSVSSMTWTAPADINFDGQVNIALRGYDDLPNIDLRQVGATGGEYVSMAGLLGFGSGGTLKMGSGGTLAMGSGGTLAMGSGGTLKMGSGGTLAMGSGGTLTMGSGGMLSFGSGGTLTFGSGGTYAMGSGGTLAMGSGGTLALGSGGTLMMGSGGTLTMGSGGTLALGSGGLLTMGSGGTFTMGSGGTLTMGSGGTLKMGSGGTLAMGSGGTLKMGSGGTFAMGSGGVFTMGSGGTFALGSGGTFLMGSGGTFTMGSGGLLTMGSGGTLALGSGGTLALGSGGTLALGSGGTLALGSGGTLKMGSGGVMEELTYETANSVVRPPSKVTQTLTTGGGLRIDWEPPSFGIVSQYHVYYRVGTDAPVAVGTVSGDPPQTTFTIASPVANAVYFVTTTVAADSESTTPRSSPPSDPAVLKYDQTITFGVLQDRWNGDQPFTVSATASSSLPVSFSAAGNCTVSGALVSLTSVGSCTITAWQPGNQGYNPAPSVARTFAITEFQAQTISFSALPNKTYGDPDFTVSATASSGLPVSFSAAGNCTVVAGATVHLTGAGSCTVTASQEGNNVYKPAPQVPQTFPIIAWTIQGFHSPVSMPEGGQPVWNVVKGGSTVPLKFNIYAGAVEQTALSAVDGGSVALYTVGCQPGDVTELAAEIDNTGSTSLRYDGTQFIQNWKTPKKANVCYAVRMTARDGSAITGYFRTK
jgi:alpha-tubulin suppressor-like RCC1 family protein